MARDLDATGGSRLAASLVYKNKVISYGINMNKSHTFQANHAKNDEAIYWHAETNAVYNGLKAIGSDLDPTKKELTGMSLYVVRAKHPDGESEGWGCMSCFYKYGIKRIVYSMDETGHYGVIYNDLS
jgi:hypothetical protein